MHDIYLIACTHFFHTNIIKYANRPFRDSEEMNTTLVEGWNNVVGKHDIVYHLGDVAFAPKEQTADIVSQLKGRKILIKGNHDQRSTAWWMSIGFKEVSSHPVIFKKKYILSHEPVELSAYSQFTNIHGHIHEKSMNTLKHINVCVEHTCYRPIALEQLGDLM